MSVPVVVSLDTCILFRLFDVEREDLLVGLRPIDWVVVDAVEAEVTYPDQRSRLEVLFHAGVIRRGTLDTDSLALFVELRSRMQDGEAAALAWAIRYGAVIASDERRRFRTEAIERLGEERILTTPGLFCLAIHAGLLDVDEADRLKAKLEAHHRFKMTFRSFSEIVQRA